MRADSPRWHEISPSEYNHEREGLAHLRDLLPDRAPYHAWTNFEFRDGAGKWHEVDALVLGERRLHLIELKHYRGTITGNAYRWRRGRHSEDSPLLLARRKAQRLKSVIVDKLREVQPGLRASAVPFVQQCVFLHAEDGRCALPRTDASDLFGLDGQEPQSGLPSIAQRVLERSEPDGQRPALIDQDDLLVMLFEKIGFALRREREVGSWRLIGSPLAEGDGWQDWPAEHRRARRGQFRIRFFVSKPGASDAERRGASRLVDREYELTRQLYHDHVLRPEDLVEDDLGVGLVYPRDENFRRLDLWLDDNGRRLSLADRVDVIRQLAEALAYAHGRHVVHRGLIPAAVVVRQQGDSIDVRLGDWRAAGADKPGVSRTPGGSPASGGSATRLFALMEGRAEVDPEQARNQAYLAPEGKWAVGADRVRVDVFALGALAYHIVSGRAPATDLMDLKDRLARDRGLDLVADVPEVPGSLRDLVLRATRPAVTERLADVQEFLAGLGKVDKEMAVFAEPVFDPLEAVPGMLLGERFELVRRLGSGSTAVGLLVKDRAAGDENRVLKVALDDAAASRLRAEAEVLTVLRRLNHPRLIRLIEPEPLRIGARTALLLERAGDRTLAQELRERPRLSLDLLERYGTDLLEALVALDKENVDHRDVKPANLGVRQQRGDRAKHLVLFDFSLSRAGAAAVEAGTPPYLDPFLGVAKRPHWDSAAERYAAAVTLFEMATGQVPSYGDGQSNPAVISDEASVEPGLFDASVAGHLVAFFRRALRRDARQRFDTGVEMLAEWRAIWADPRTSTVPDDADALAAAAQPTTPLPSAGLSARALSALEPFNVNTVGDLVAVDPVRLARLSGVAESTRREVRARTRQWRERLGADVRTTQQASGETGEWLADLTETSEALVRAAGSTSRRECARRLLGLSEQAPADTFAPLAELAPALGLRGQPQASRMLGDLQEMWAADPDAKESLDVVLFRAHGLLTELGGVATVDTLVPALSEAAPGQRADRIAAGLLRVALDRAEIIERAGGDAGGIARRRRRGGRPQVVATAPLLLDVADVLGRRADELVQEAVDAGEDIVPAGRAADRLRSVWPPSLPAPDDVRLVRLAASLSTRSGGTRPGELHDWDIDPSTTVAIALRGLASKQRLTAKDLAERVRARFPDLPPLPGRPALDRVVTRANLGLQWDGEMYTTPSQPTDTTLASRGSTIHISVRPGGVAATREDTRLAESIQSRSFLALGAPPQRLDEAALALTERHGAQRVDVTAVLLGALREEATRRGVSWHTVQSADVAEPGSRPAQGLAALVRDTLPAVEAAISEAAEGAPEGTLPVLLIDAAPLARYGHTELLARLADVTVRRTQAIWLLLPDGPGSGAVLDGVPLRLGHGGQFLRLHDDWLKTPALEGEPA